MIGQAISGYRIIEELRHAGLGEVYLARDTELGRLVSLKLFPAGLAGQAEALERAFSEARAACDPSHPHICTVHGTGHHEGRPFVAIEVMEGEPLSRRVAAGPLDTDIFLDLGVQIADALQAAHTRKVFHGALDLENVLVTEGDQIKVMDFGIARLAAGSVGSRADDMQALGQILYAMATGISLGEIAEGADRPAASSVNPKAPAALDPIIERAIGSGEEPAYGSVKDIAEDLTRVMIDEAPGYTAPPPDPGSPVAEKTGLPWGLMAGVGFLLAAAALLIRACG